MKKKQHYPDQLWSGIKKLLLIMKLTVFFLFLSVMAIAAGTYAQETRFDLNVKNVNIIQVFDEIERVTEFGFLFKTDQLDLSKTYTIELKSANIEKILNDVLNKEQYTYTLIDKNIVITRIDAKTIQDQKSVKISGKVTDKTGVGVPGASVIVKGTTLGITTDYEGNYTLSIPADAKVIVFSFVGMTTQEVAVGAKSVYNVVLSE